MITNKYLQKIAGAIEDHANRGKFLENEIRMLHAAHSGEAFPGKHIAGDSPAAKLWEQHHTVTTSGLHSPMHAERTSQAIGEYGSKLVKEFGTHSSTHQRLLEENAKRVAGARQKVSDRLPSTRPMPTSVSPTPAPAPAPASAPTFTPNGGRAVEASRSKMDSLIQGRKAADAPKAVNPLPVVSAEAVPPKPSVTEFGQGPAPKPVDVPRPGEIQTDIAAKTESKVAEKGGQATNANWKRFLPKSLAGKAVAGIGILGVGGLAASQMREKKAADYLQKIAETGIDIKPSHQGFLHQDLGIPEGEHIPLERLEAAKNSSDPKVRRRATFALNARNWRH